METLKDISAQLAAVVERVGRVVISVTGRRRVQVSGVVWRDGVVVTNDHILAEDDTAGLVLPEGKSIEAHIVGRDPGTDLAVLRAEQAIGLPLSAAPIDEVRAGNLLLVVGRSANAGITATLGMVSAVSGEWRTWRGGWMTKFVRVDASLYPLAYGGAVADTEGRIIGIATPAMSRMSPLAIPAATVDGIVDQILERGHVSRGYLGVGLLSVALPQGLAGKTGADQTAGLIVLSVEPGSPADRSGLTLGDVVYRLNDTSVADTDDVQSVLKAVGVGNRVQIRLLRAGEPKEVTLELGERPRGGHGR